MNNSNPNINNDTNNSKRKPRSDEVHKKISDAHKGKIILEKTKERRRISHLGKKPTLETRKKMGNAHKGKPRSEETKQKISKGHKGKIISEKTKEKLRNFYRDHKHPACGIPRTEEVKRKIRNATLGKKRTEKTCKNISLGKLGKKLTESHRQNIGKGNKGRIVTEETRKKISKSNKGKKHTPHTIGWRKKVSKSNMGHIVTEITRKKIRENQLGEKGHNYGKKMLDHIKEKISKTTRGCKAHTWKGGISYLPYCFKFNTRRKRAVRIFFGDYCICCGKHVTENITKRGQYEHSVHHVDHDKEQGCNGKPFNLVPLCVKCHTRELGREQEYRNYINKTLEEGFKWGIWSREQYEIEVMYPE